MNYTLEDFKNIIKRLRSENGCPWDKVQTHETLKEAMIEEAYEVLEAINKNNIENLKEIMRYNGRCAFTSSFSFSNRTGKREF